jgi:hypothetical protein
MFNEKIFLFLWFWYFLLAGATVCSLLYWIFISTVPSRQLNFVGKYLTGIEGYKMVDSQSLRRFVFHFLRQDGVFLLRMVATHAGELVRIRFQSNLPIKQGIILYFIVFCRYNQSVYFVITVHYNCFSHATNWPKNSGMFHTFSL